MVDLRDRDEVRDYERDLRDSPARYARQVDPAGSAVVGAFIGRVIGAAFGAAVGDRSVALDLARVGAVRGGVAGAAEDHRYAGGHHPQLLAARLPRLD